MKPTKQPEMEIEEHSIWQPGPAARAAYVTGSPVIQIQPAIVGRGDPTVSAHTPAEQEASAAAMYAVSAKRERDRLIAYARITGCKADHSAAQLAAEEAERAAVYAAAAITAAHLQRDGYTTTISEAAAAIMARQEQRRQHLDALLIAARQEETAAGAKAADLWTAGRKSQRPEDIAAAGIAIDAVHVATARRRQLEIEIMGLQEPTP